MIRDYSATASEAESSCAAPLPGRAVLVGDRPQCSGAAAAEVRPAGPSPGTTRQRLGGSGRKRSRAAPRPSRGGPCWLATARSAAERRRQKCGPPGPARERRNQRLGDSGRSGVELRRAPPGAGRASWRPPAAQRSGGGRSAAHRAQPGDGAEVAVHHPTALARRGEWKLRLGRRRRDAGLRRRGWWFSGADRAGSINNGEVAGRRGSVGHIGRGGTWRRHVRGGQAPIAEGRPRKSQVVSCRATSNRK